MRGMILAAALLAGLAPGAALWAEGRPLRVAAWNLHNLAEPGAALRGNILAPEDYATITAILAALDADVLALQEVGSEAAARAILPPGYEVILEQRCHDGPSACQRSEGEIHNAVAWRPATVGPTQVAMMPGLPETHTDECPGSMPRPMRGIPLLRFAWNGAEHVVGSVHLKAGCRRERNRANPDLIDDCDTHAAQIGAIADWLAGVPADTRVVLIGDWNRRLDAPRDPARRRLLAAARGVAILPNDRGTCWNPADVNQGQWRRAAETRFPQITARGYQPSLYLPSFSSFLNHALVANLGAGPEAVARIHDLPQEARAVRDVTDHLRTCPPEAAPQADARGRVLTFLRSFPSDHCPFFIDLPAP